MPNTSYKIWAWGNQITGSATAPWHVGVNGVAKKADAGLPFLVANELICARLARLLGLPIPPSFVVEKDGEPYHVSLNFHLAGEALPPVDPVALVAEHPELACGVVLFDAWIVNMDRHRQNLAFDTYSKAVTLFDHSHSFYYGQQPQTYLANAASSLSIGGHCLAQELTSASNFSTWLRRLAEIPRFQLEDAVHDAIIDPFTTADANFALEFLLDRRDRLAGLLSAAGAIFPKVQPDLWTAAMEGTA
jgi:hypothetical protein